MENILLKDIAKITFIFISSLVILSLLFFNGQPGIALAITIGALLGIFRLKVFFSHITCSFDHEKSGKATIALIKYLANWLFTLSVIGFILVKSMTIGLAMLLGLITVSITVTVYAMLKGISLYRKNDGIKFLRR